MCCEVKRRVCYLVFLLRLVSLWSVALFRGQVLLDDFTALCTHLGDVVAASVLDGLMEGKSDGARRYIEGAAWHDAIAAIDGDRHDWQAKLQCEFESTVLEWTHEACIGAASLGEYHN